MLAYFKKYSIPVFLFSFIVLLVINAFFIFYSRGAVITTLVSLKEKLDATVVHSAQTSTVDHFNKILIFQFFIILIFLFILLFIIFRLKKDDNARVWLLKQFSTSNAKYIFNAGNEIDYTKAENVVGNFVENLKNTSSFIKDTALGNYDTQWPGLTSKNSALNEDSIVGSMIRMRDEMKRVKEEDKRRLWVTDGLAQFSELVRNHQDSVNKLAEAVVRFLTKYLDAQQGSLFILTAEEGNEPYLQLEACYAFDKKKYVEKVIDIGNGLIGQTYLDQKTAVLSQLPKGYTHITSGLGGATASSLVIVPMMYNQQVECIFELAGFDVFQNYQIQFLEKAGEFVASAIHFVKTNGRTASLLKQSQEQTEMLRAQEEEMRQNMEELQATQEEMARKEKELSKRLEEIERMKEASALQSRQMIETVEKSKKDAMEILNHVPEVIFLKDSKGYMVICNEPLAKLYGLPIEKIIGTHDYDFHERSLAQSYFEKEQEIIKNGAETYIQEDNLTGEKRLFKTVKCPFILTILMKQACWVFSLTSHSRRRVKKTRKNFNQKEGSLCYKLKN